MSKFHPERYTRRYNGFWLVDSTEDREVAVWLEENLQSGAPGQGGGVAAKFKAFVRLWLRGYLIISPAAMHDPVAARDVRTLEG